MHKPFSRQKIGPPPAVPPGSFSFDAQFFHVRALWRHLHLLFAASQRLLDMFNSWCWRKDASAALTGNFHIVVHLKNSTTIELPRHFVKELMVQKCPLSPTVPNLSHDYLHNSSWFASWLGGNKTTPSLFRNAPNVKESRVQMGGSGQWHVRVWKEMNKACFRSSITCIYVCACVYINKQGCLI